MSIKKSDNKPKKLSSEHFYIYALHCPGADRPYIGQTKDLIESIAKHYTGSYGEFTAKFRPSRLIHLEVRKSRELAIERKLEIIAAIEAGNFKYSAPYELDEMFYRVVAMLYPGDPMLPYVLTDELKNACINFIEIPIVKGFNDI